MVAVARTGPRSPSSRKSHLRSYPPTSRLTRPAAGPRPWFRALSTRVAKRWQFVSFRGTNKGEWRGVVDLIAIRKDTAEPKSGTLKRGDLFDLVLVQVKGGSARAPTMEDRRRLREVAKLYRARAIVQFCGERARARRFRCCDATSNGKSHPALRYSGSRLASNRPRPSRSTFDRRRFVGGG